MVLLGVDPGLAAIGYGVLASERRGPLRLLDHGCLRTSAETEMGERLRLIRDGFVALLARWQPEVMVLERLYQLRGGGTGLVVGQAIGVIRLTACDAGIPVVEYAPTHVKQTLVGYGQAEKEQVQFMVQRLLGLAAPPRPDHAADALALCVCHLHSGLSQLHGSSGSSGAGSERLAAALAADDRRRAEYLRREAERR